MTRDAAVENRDVAPTTRRATLPNVLTIAGTGVPVSYEITTEGPIEMDARDPIQEATIVSGTAAEGAIDHGVQRFWFDGDLADLTVGDHDVSDFDALDVASVEVEYDAAGR